VKAINRIGLIGLNINILRLFSIRLRSHFLAKNLQNDLFM
jgi:hypothetical protein